MQFEVLDLSVTSKVSCLKQQVLAVRKTTPATTEDKSSAKSLQALNRFPWKLYQIVKACKSGAIGWDESGRTLLVRPLQFQREFLEPSNSVFKTKNFGSFVRQLNLYGFRKIQPSRNVFDDQPPKKSTVYSFRNNLFLRDRLDLLDYLHRNIGIRKDKQGFKCNRKQDAQENQMKTSSICSKLPMILPSTHRAWPLSSGLDSSAELISWVKVNCFPNFGDCRRPLEESVKAECQKTLHEAFIESKLRTGRDDDPESQEITMVKKEDFDEIVSIFAEMLNQDPDVRDAGLARMDCGISPAVLDLIRRAKIIRDYEARLSRSISETSYLPVHDSSFSFSANASRPIFKIADNHVTNAVRTSLVEKKICNQCTSMDFDNYKENLAYL